MEHESYCGIWLLKKGATPSLLKNIIESKFETLKDSEELYEYDMNSSNYDIDYIFNSIYEQKSDGYKNLKVWHHVDTSKINYNWMKYGIARDELIDSATRYLDIENKWAQSKELDWVLIDLLMFAEYVATVSEAQKYKFNGSEYYKYNENIPDNLRLKKRFSRWLWFVAFIGSLIFYYPVAIVIGIAFFIRFTIRFLILKKLTEAYHCAGIAYDSILTGDWEVVWEDLNYSRRKGVVWDKQIFEIVKKNL